jgi:hypothetical protein
MSDQTIPDLLQEIEALQIQAGPGACKEDRIAAVTRVEHLLMGNCSQIILYCRKIELERDRTQIALNETFALVDQMQAEALKGFEELKRIQDVLVDAVKGLPLAELIALNRKISEVRAGL